MSIKGLIYNDGKPLFPISWLHKHGYCEYQLYLEHVAGIKVEPTKQMIEGKQEHEVLYQDFNKGAVPATIGEMLSESKKAQVLSREFFVVDPQHGIYGLIDEVLMTPESFIVIEDKPGRKSYLSNINQVFGYCLAFKHAVVPEDTRPIIGALRERGTDNIYWNALFDSQMEGQIVQVVERVHSLLVGGVEFDATANPKKCGACRFHEACDHFCPG